MIASAHSQSVSGTHVFTLPLRDPQGGMSSTGGYPWFINGTASTIIFIKNTTSQAQRFHLDIVYHEQGAAKLWGSNTRLVAAGQTVAFDVRKIRDEQQPGSAGNTIPLTAGSGHVAWSALGETDKVFTGRAQTTDTVKGLVSTYECQCTCGYSYNASQLLPFNISGFVDDYTSLYAQEKDWLCYGTSSSWYDINYKSTFSSQYPAIASCNGSVATAISPGTTSLYASFAATQKIWTGFGCSSVPVSPVASTTCVVENCVIPSGESTISNGWNPFAESKHNWIQRLLPHTTNFTGRRVYEQDSGGGPDTCWFEGSERAKFDRVTNDPSQYWTVRTANEWGPDVVGWSPVAVSYYRSQGRAPCSTAFYQTMVINCGNALTPYSTRGLAAGIGTTTVYSLRAGEVAQRTYP